LVYALERILRFVQRGLTHTAARWPPIQTAYTLVFRAVHILNNDEQVSAGEVRRCYAQILHEMQDAITRLGTDALVQAWYTTFLKVTANYGETLFWCYDHPDLPRTNNDLEHLFGSLRYHERRASGSKQVAPMLLLRGQARVLASVSTRLRTYQATDLPPENLAWLSVAAESARRPARNPSSTASLSPAPTVLPACPGEALRAGDVAPVGRRTLLVIGGQRNKHHTVSAHTARFLTVHQRLPT
jgi:hypothetical protein